MPVPQHVLDEHRAAAMAARAEHRAAAMAARAGLLDAASLRDVISAADKLGEALNAAVTAIVEHGAEPDRATLVALGFDGGIIDALRGEIDALARRVARRITRADLDAANTYAAAVDLIVDGNLEFEEGLGEVIVRGSVRAAGHIEAGAGTAINAGASIEAGTWIKAGKWIVAGDGIEAGWGIEAGDGIEAGHGIEADHKIKAGHGIKAGSGIEAGWGMEAGDGIEAGHGIEAGFAIDARWVSARLRIFVGTVSWRLPTATEQQLRAEIRAGTLVFGEHAPPLHRSAS